MLAVTGDSIALGLAAYLHPPPAIIQAHVGIGSAAATPLIPRARHLVVSLGTNDDDRYGLPGFRRAVRVSLRRGRCVTFLKVRRHPRRNRVLRRMADRYSRLHLVPISGVQTVDGWHPTPAGYQILAARVQGRCQPPHPSNDRLLTHQAQE